MPLEHVAFDSTLINAGGGSILRDISADISDPFSFGFHVATGQLLNVLVQDGVSAHLFISATYCQVGKSYDFDGASSSIPASVSLIFDGLSASTEAPIAITLESANDSAYAPDYSCFRVRAKSKEFNTSITFAAVYVIIEPQRLERNELPSPSIGEALYEPLQGSALVQYRASTSSSPLLVKDPGAWLTIDDVLAPQFKGCPTETLLRKAVSNQEAANVSWYDFIRRLDSNTLNK
jgi:hypothetical protein